jgi:AcrR family transcriptional regulator
VTVTAERAYGGVSAVDRRAARRERLVEAALDIVGADDASAITVTRLCKEAGLNERYFYESFRDRAEVLVAAGDHVATVLAGRILERLATAAEDARSRASAAIGAAVDVLTEDPRKGALFLQTSHTPELAQRRVDLTGAFVELLLSQALATLRLERTPDVDSWGRFAATHLFGGVLETITAWMRGQLAITRDELVERNVEMFLAVGDSLPRQFPQERSRSTR